MLQSSSPEKFFDLFHKLNHFRDLEQKQITCEMIEVITKMDRKELNFIFEKGLYNNIYMMTEEKKISIENAIYLLKQIGYNKTLKNSSDDSFRKCSLKKRLGKMIIEEEMKIEEKNENLLIDLCDCYLMNYPIICYGKIPKKMLSILVCYLVKSASKKEDKEEAQEEVELALLTLSNIWKYVKERKDQHLNEIKEVIKFHQVHRNLTRLAYQSAWKLLINRLNEDKSLEDMIVNELHFAREAKGELIELEMTMNLIKQNGDDEKGKEGKRDICNLISEWLDSIYWYFYSAKIKTEENVKLLDCIISLCKKSMNLGNGLSENSYYYVGDIMETDGVSVDDVLKSDAIKYFMNETQQSTLVDDVISPCMRFFKLISKWLNKGRKNEIREDFIEEISGEIEISEWKWLKKKVIETLEEEGYEDILMSFSGSIVLRSRGSNKGVENYVICC
ncbi:uncharacterized protein MONOS_18663 [Monocercomonoides exilis]|uniref:uncharacterized protein n=1 Tax=Monocercomonoides exilis TaxID=2049356 RepID=UPI00355A603A|nr:hypothetical protein MONOS_18663 [Monocercomonoides exilis]